MVREEEARSPNPRFRGGTGTIFCDEAGFTGNNLLDRDQEVFVYVGLAIDPERAQALVEQTVRDFQIQGNEIKGSRLLKTESGRTAVTKILKTCVSDTRTVYHWKTYALACKIFEYIFEPALAEQNSIYYDAGFHRFVSTLLFTFFRAKDRTAEDFFQDFATWARDGSAKTLERLFPCQSLVVQHHTNPLEAVATFATLHRNKIREELRPYHQNPTTPNWILDLTTTSIFSVLCSLGELYDQLDVYIDRSKPLETEGDILHTMVNRKDKIRVRMFGKERPYSFNLTKLPSFVNSKDHPGIQLADVIASALASALQGRLRNQVDKQGQGWLALALPATLEDCILPDLKQADPHERSAFVNSALLMEVIDRSLKKESLFDGIPEFLHRMHQNYPAYRASLYAQEEGHFEKAGLEGEQPKS
jgi:hypothetical protein